MGLSIASIFIVGGSIVPAFADAANRNIPIPNVEYTTEDWYVKENAHLIKNKDVSDLRNIVEFTVDTSQGIDKDTMMRFVDLDTASEEVKMDNSFDGKYYVPGISPSDWWLKKNADGWIGNSTTNADNETFKTGFAFFVHNGKITFQAKANSAGFCIAANGVDNMYGSLRIIKR